MAAILPLEDPVWALGTRVLNHRMPALYEEDLGRHHTVAPTVFRDLWDHHLQAYHLGGSMVLGRLLLMANIKAKPFENGTRRMSAPNFGPFEGPFERGSESGYYPFPHCLF